MLTFQKYVHFMRTQFPPGSRVLLLSNDQPQTRAGRHHGNTDENRFGGPVPGELGHGKRTALNLEDDHFRIFQAASMELKLYFPPRGTLHPQ